ncbi:MAG: hypothetical protein WC901_01505 [Candidatus Margulisiibacteriota bacterium]
MKKIIVLSLILILSASATFAAAPYFNTPTINGATGLVRIPSADILAHKDYLLAVDYGSNAMAGKESLYYKINVGAFPNMELGCVGGYDQTATTTTLRDGVYINTKLSLSTDTGPNPLLLAIGGENLASSSQSEVYMVATKYMRQGFKLTFGFMGDFPGNRFRPMGVAGVEVPLLNNQLLLMVDGLAGETISQVDAGARFFLLPSLAIHANALNVFQDTANFAGKDPKSYLIGVSWLNPF